MAYLILVVVTIWLLSFFRARLPVWRLLDAFAPAMLAGQAIGRFG